MVLFIKNSGSHRNLGSPDPLWRVGQLEPVTLFCPTLLFSDRPMFICPVLKRPHLLDKLLVSWYEYSVAPLTILTAHDDPQRDAYHRIVSQYESSRRDDAFVSIIDYPSYSRGTVSALNYYYRLNPYHGYYGFIGEDCELLTSNHDLVLGAQTRGLSYPDDGFHHSNLCTHPVIHGDIVRAAGFLGYPPLFHSYFDNVWHVIGQGCAILDYCPNVVYRHNHPLITGRAQDAIFHIAQDHLTKDETWFRHFLQYGANDKINSMLRQLTRDFNRKPIQFVFPYPKEET